MRAIKSILIAVLLLATADLAGAQALLASAENADANVNIPLPAARWDNQLELAPPAQLPEMSPELAFAVFTERQAQQQNRPPASYSAEITVAAELPDTHQHGRFELVRNFTAPGRLRFKPGAFTGDDFVRTNVINRWLASEAQRAQQGPDPRAALSPANYKFSYKGRSILNGELADVYQVKPRSHAAGVFKGRIFIDARSGSLVRAEGRLAHSPSFFIKKIEFVTDFQNFFGATMPVRIHSVASTRVIGRAVLDITTSDYDFHPDLLAAR